MDMPSIEKSLNSEYSAEMTPIAVSERIEVLDVIRGFALIGIFLMNIEFFNRSITEIGNGMPKGLTGMDWWASFFVAYFVAGKFWTIFSILFGMGFAVMLARAQAKSQAFFKPYLRRIVALAVFGAVHHILIWPGDILFSYAVAACALLLVLFVPALWYFVIMGLLLIPAMMFKSSEWIGGIVLTAVFGVIAFYLRSEKKWIWRSWQLPITSGVIAVLALFAFLFGLVGALVSTAKALLPLLSLGMVLSLLSWLFTRFHTPKESRPMVFGLALYVLMFASMTLGSFVDYQSKKLKKESLPTVAAQVQKADASVSALGASAAILQASQSSDPATMGASKEKVVDEREKAIADAKQKNEKLKEDELKAVKSGSYWDVMAVYQRHFIDDIGNHFAMSSLVVCLFLIGYWFVRSGVISNHVAHRALFRKLAFFGITTGWVLSLLSAYVRSQAIGVDEGGLHGVAMGILYLGNLPACLGYLSAVVLMCQSAGSLSKIKVLAPYGRMALTNYLMQSVICVLVFYHYGLGYFGMPRAEQLGFVAVVVVAQVMLSHWWLSNFLYGPMEWLWRAITYLKLPTMKRA